MRIVKAIDSPWLGVLLERKLAVAVVLLGFVIASFPARNSDLWLHLATGRALAQGQADPHTDPFAYTTDGAYWVNHSWLIDRIAYEFFSRSPDGFTLMVAKCVLVTLLAVVLLVLGWRGGGLGWPG